MIWNKFLKPDWRKIVLWLLLFITIGFVSRTGACLYDEEGTPVYCDKIVGFPLEFKLFADYSTPINYTNLTINLIFYYLLSCLIIWIYDEVKNK